MTVDEISARLRARLQEEYGVDEAAILMDRPPGGWGDLVTNQSLDRRFSEFEARLDAKLDARFASLDARFASLGGRFENVDAKLETFDAKLETLDARFDSKLGALHVNIADELRSQTSRYVTTTIAALTSLTGAIAIFVAIATSR